MAFQLKKDFIGMPYFWVAGKPILIWEDSIHFPLPITRKLGSKLVRAAVKVNSFALDL